jgi:glutamine amidotransferase
MCRWLAYSGDRIPLEYLIFVPEHSLIHQSLEAFASPTPTNGDGFGVGWYDERRTPALYRSVQPAWNDANLREVAAHVSSHLFLAHVRAATGTAVQQTNCHPFRWDKWLLVHNGVIADFARVKRDLVLAVKPELFPEIDGTTDSEIMLYLALTFGLENDPLGGLARMAGFIEEVGNAHGIQFPVQMTLGVSDGKKLYGVRYSSERRTRTLFVSRGVRHLRELYPERMQHFSEDSRVIVSEPLANLAAAWQEVPESTALIVEHGEVEMVPFSPMAAESARAG